MQYIKEGFTLPAPFNLIPVPSAIYKVIKKSFKYLKEKNPPETAEETNANNQIDQDSNTTNKAHDKDKTYSVENQKLTYRV